ncbi:lateral signaling target protein 2 homolog isoform X1 [Asterias amurensis]|uniref:lateral signaling target protein 2 homolog isoform X1 n=1 Tax=Asterias amurensis TaxID=7602 RepID=UPI003AB4EA0F
MMSIRKWLYKPKKTDNQLLAQFYFSDEELNAVSQELDSFDGRQDPERCTLLVNQLRTCQDRVLAIVEQVMDHAIVNERANRDFRAKFPDDVLQDSLAGQLWFGAECLAAGSTIMNREIESAALRPIARGLTRSLDVLRSILREQCYKDLNHYSDKVKDGLRKFDEMFAEFELSYVSAMVPVKTAREYDTQQDVIVLFCETLDRALKKAYVTQDQVDDYDPALMFTIPRLAIVGGLFVFPSGPLNMERDSRYISELFRPFQGLLLKIKELLETLHEEELILLEKALCSTKDSWEDIEKQLNEMSLNYDTPRSGRSRRTSRNPDSICLSPCDSMMTECSMISSSFMSTPEGADLMQRLSFSESWHELSQEVLSVEEEGLPCEASGSDARVPSPRTSGVKVVRNHSDAVVEQGAASSPHGYNEVEEEGNGDLKNNNFFALRNSNQESNHETNSPVIEAPPAVNGDRVDRPNHPPRLTREDSGLGSAPEMELMDLFINVPPMLQNSVEVELNGDGGLVRVHSHETVPHSSKTNPSLLRIETGHLQDSVGVSTNGERPLPITTPNGSDFAPTFFGKGKPSTELSLVGARTSPTVNNRHHLDFTSEGPVSPSRIIRQNSLDSPSPNNHSEPTSFFQRIRHGSGRRSSMSDQESSRASTPNRDISASAINRVEGSRGVRRVKVQSEVPGDGDGDGDNDGSSSSCSSSCCGGDDEVCSYQWESDGSDSDSTSYLSENNDEFEIAMAIEAAEIAARQEMRSHFRSSSDLVHRLFVCIAGVADQLQTNYASDLRNILKTVFIMCATEPYYMPVEETTTNNSPAEEQINEASGAGIAASGTDEKTHNHSPKKKSSPPNGKVHFESNAPTNGSVSNEDVFSNENSEIVNTSSASKSSACGESQNDDQGPSSTGDQVQEPSSSTSSCDAVVECVAETSAVSDGSTPEPKERKRHRSGSRNRRTTAYQDPPLWVPDDSATECTSCKALFTMLRRKHHCRNCGRIFCNRCSANSVPLPRYGQLSPVRVCNRCYMFQVTPFQH